MSRRVIAIAHALFKRDIEELPQSRNYLLALLLGLLTACANVEDRARDREGYGCQNFVSLLDNVVTGEQQDMVSRHGKTFPNQLGPGRMYRSEVIIRLETLAFDYFHDAPKYDGIDKSRAAYQLWAAAYAAYRSSEGEGVAHPWFIIDGRVSARRLAEACAEDDYKTDHDPAALIDYVDWPE